MTPTPRPPAPPPPEVEDVWMTAPDLRDYLDLSPSTLRRLVARGLPCVGTGRLRRFHVPTVVKWLSAHLGRSG